MGVSNLWTLLEPAGRRINVEALTGKRLAVDASIWLIQFVKAMRDQKGEVVKNAHLLGFFRRICKLLFHQIKPVFVFDGATPALKRRTVIARRQRREHQATKLKKTAEKLLMNHMKQHALASPTPGILRDGGQPASQNAGLGMSEPNVHSSPGPSTPAVLDGDGDPSDSDLDLPEDLAVVDPEVLFTLPPSVQYEILLKMREKHFGTNREKLVTLTGQPKSFSDHQMESYLEASKLRREIEEIRQKTSCTDVNDGLQAPGDHEREYILHTSTTLSTNANAHLGTTHGPENRDETLSSMLRMHPPQLPEQDLRAETTSMSEKHLEISFTVSTSSEEIEWEEDEAQMPGQISNKPVEDDSSDLIQPPNRQKCWSLSHGFKFGRSLANWANSDERCSQDSTLCVEDLQVQEAIRQSLEQSADQAHGPQNVTQPVDVAGPSQPCLLSKGPQDMRKGATLHPSDCSRMKVDQSNDTERCIVETSKNLGFCRSSQSNQPNDDCEQVALPRNGLVQDVCIAEDLSAYQKDSARVEEDYPPTVLNAGIPSRGPVHQEEIQIHASFCDELIDSVSIRTGCNSDRPEPAKNTHVPEAIEGVCAASVRIDDSKNNRKYEGAASGVTELKVTGGETKPRRESSNLVVHDTFNPSARDMIKSAATKETADGPNHEQEKVVDMTKGSINDAVPAQTKAKFPEATGTRHQESHVAAMDEDIANLQSENHQLKLEADLASRNADAPTTQMYAECQEMLQMFGIPYMIAPMEAEAQCAYLNSSGLVDGVVTEDNDVFLFGAQSVYRHLFEDKKYVEEYLTPDIEDGLGFDREKLIHLAMLLGCDYTEGVSGIGIVNATEVVQSFRGATGLHAFREWLKTPDEELVMAVRARDMEQNPDDLSAGSDSGKPIRDFKFKHRGVRKNWVVPDSFPNSAIVEAFMQPQIDSSKDKIIFGRPDVDLLRSFCWERFGWEPQKTDELLLPAVKGLERREQQLRMDSFVAFRERFAKIKSKRLRKAVAGITGEDNPDIMLGSGDGICEVEGTASLSKHGVLEDHGRKKGVRKKNCKSLHYRRATDLHGSTEGSEDHPSDQFQPNPVNRRVAHPRKAKRKRKYAESDL